MSRLLFSGTRNIIFGTLKIGQNDAEIPNLEFESHGFLKNQVFFPTKQAETYPKIYILTYYLSYVCSVDFQGNCDFQILNLGFPGHFDQFGVFQK